MQPNLFMWLRWMLSQVIQGNDDWGSVRQFIGVPFEVCWCHKSSQLFKYQRETPKHIRGIICSAFINLNGQRSNIWWSVYFLIIFRQPKLRFQSVSTHHPLNPLIFCFPLTTNFYNDLDWWHASFYITKHSKWWNF